MTTAPAGNDGGSRPAMAGLTAPRRGGSRLAAFLALVAALALTALGVWQIERRTWKLDLIARVEARLAAAPVPVPSRSAWSRVSQASDEYRRVTVTGRFLPQGTARVMAVTTQGPGFWLLTPLQTSAGDIVFINRGFVPPDWQSPAAQDDAPVTISGLLRMPELGGGFLRGNDPAADKWYSRDVQGIAAAHGLGPVAPFFIDADGSRNGPGRPMGGLTVVSFHNAHLIYALTWFGLAGLSVMAAVRFLREPRR